MSTNGHTHTRKHSRSKHCKIVVVCVTIFRHYTLKGWPDTHIWKSALWQKKYQVRVLGLVKDLERSAKVVRSEYFLYLQRILRGAFTTKKTI